MTSHSDYMDKVEREKVAEAAFRAAYAEELRGKLGDGRVRAEFAYNQAMMATARTYRDYIRNA